MLLSGAAWNETPTCSLLTRLGKAHPDRAGCPGRQHTTAQRTSVRQCSPKQCSHFLNILRAHSVMKGSRGTGCQWPRSGYATTGLVIAPGVIAPGCPQRTCPQSRRSVDMLFENPHFTSSHWTPPRWHPPNMHGDARRAAGSLPRSSSSSSVPGKLMPGWTRSPPSSSEREKQRQCLVCGWCSPRHTQHVVHTSAWMVKHEMPSHAIT